MHREQATTSRQRGARSGPDSGSGDRGHGRLDPPRSDGPSVDHGADELEVNPAAFTYYRRLGKVRGYVEAHLAEELSVKTAARIAGLAEKYFSTFFRRKTGICYRDWISLLRVRRAKERLKTRNHSVVSVAAAVGFHDVRSFGRAFKNHTGMTPLEYKKAVRPC